MHRRTAALSKDREDLHAISLARSMGLRTIAEGVETPAQLALLRRFGCDEIQDYLLSQPLPQAAFIRVIEQAVAFSLPSPPSGEQIP